MTQRLFEALEEIGSRMAQAPCTLLCVDFDGTLAPLADHPKDVYLSAATRQALAALAGREGLALAIISGRERGDLQTRIGLPGLVYAGNHGLEISGPGLTFVEPAAAGQTEAVQRLAAELRSRLTAVPGAFVEDKGLTLSVHYRQVAADAAEEVRHIVHAVLAATNHPFHLTMGDKVFEIRPRVDWNKGNAIRWIQEQVADPKALVVYLGDDATDEDAFAALADGVTVKIGQPAETAAHYCLDSPAEVLAFLKWLTSQADTAVVVG